MDYVSIRQRLYPSPMQVGGLVMHADHARFVYNIGLNQRKMWKRDKHLRGDLSASRITNLSQQRELAQLRADTDWLRAGSSAVQQVALRDLDRAFTNFYAGRAKYPTFKRRSDREGSFAVRDLKVARLNRKWGTVLVPKIGPVRFRVSRLWTDIEAATSAKVTLKNGQWHVSFTTPPAPKIVAGTGAVTGIDRGVKNTLALSDGVMFQAPSLTTAERVRFVILERQLARQNIHARRTKNWDSNRRKRSLTQLASLRCRLDCRRADWVEKTTTTLARTYDLIAVEDLRISNMTRTAAGSLETPGTNVAAKSGLSRAILASCWGKTVQRLEHKLLTGSLVKVNPRNTSRMCAVCKHVSSENRDSQADFSCKVCGHQAHADTNAAINILNLGLARTGLANPLAAGHAVTGRISLHPSGQSRVNQPAA